MIIMNASTFFPRTEARRRFARAFFRFAAPWVGSLALVALYGLMARWGG